MLASRLCHDLASPLGGMLNALDVAQHDPSAIGEVVAAGDGLRQRFMLLRAAWGAPGDVLAAPGLRDLVRGMPSGGRVAITIDLQPQGASFGPIRARLAVNVLLLASECLPRGGGVTLRGDPRSVLTATLDGRDARWPAGLSAILSSEAAAWIALEAADHDMNPRGLQAPVTALLIRHAGAGAKLQPGAAGQPQVLRLDVSKASAD